MSETLRDKSRRNWVSTEETFKAVNCGSLQRIADAVEKMCLDREALERRVERLSDACDDALRELYAERRRNAALRGVITKLRRAASARRRVRR